MLLLGLIPFAGAIILLVFTLLGPERAGQPGTTSPQRRLLPSGWVGLLLRTCGEVKA